MHPSQMLDSSCGASKATCLVLRNENELALARHPSGRAGGIGKLAAEYFLSGLSYLNPFALS